MPAPSIVVNLTDAEGRVHCVRLWGLRKQWTNDPDYLVNAAIAESDRLHEIEPHWNPTHPLTISGIESLNQEEN